MNKVHTLLVDMDMTLVDMIKVWIKKYNEETGENVRERDIKEYELRKYTEKPEILDKILSQKDFFFDMSPIKGACKYMTKLIDDGYDVVVVTQLPRRCNHWAAKDKRSWLEEYVPRFDIQNVIFTHRKGLVSGDVLFDDSPHHISSWQETHPKGLVCTIDYLYNKDVRADARFKKDEAWEKFYDFVKKHS